MSDVVIRLGEVVEVPVNIGEEIYIKGDKGNTFFPNVSENGDLNWSNDGGLPNPPTVNIKGSAGADGAPGADGDDGVSPSVTVSSITGGHRITITDKDHPQGQSIDVMDGADGQTGPAGPGVPAGGSTGQVLKKKSATDYDTEWANETTVDSALSDSSTNPVQNKVVTAAIINNSNDYNTRIATYGGTDLSTVFANAAAFHAAVASGDFSKIHIGDYWPITLNGTYTDFARFTVPSGTTYYSDAELTTEVAVTEAAYEGEYKSATAIKFKVSDTDVYAAIGDCTAGWQKSMNAVAKMEVAAINPYLYHGDTKLNEQHILLVSRDCLPQTFQYRCVRTVWFDPAQVNPWRGSALWETLNNADNGIIKLVEATSLGAYVFKGPNNKGMRAMLAVMPEGASSPTNFTYTDRGRLFLPTEREVYGAPVFGNGIYETGNLYNQWPIFTGSSRHIYKAFGDGGGNCSWWLQTPTGTHATAFTRVYQGFLPADAGAENTYISLPLCFLLT